MNCLLLTFSQDNTGGCALTKEWDGLITQETRIQETEESALEKGRAVLRMTEGQADTEQTASQQE